jgi:eukaryotic-like serine/threonine-protein kinase
MSNYLGGNVMTAPANPTQLGWAETLPHGHATGAAATVPMSSAMPASLPMSGRTTLRATLPKVKREGDDAIPVLAVDDRDRYQHQKELGAGGMGEVIKAVDNDIGRDVAVKRLFPDANADPEAVERFVEEIRIVGQMEHPNIVPIHDVGVDGDGRYFFVMKYVEGETLESIIDKLKAGDPVYHARFGFAQRVAIFMGVLEAVHYAHSRGIVHRDIKPANVMVGPFGEVMLMDWGIAKRVGTPDPPLLTVAKAEPAASDVDAAAGAKTMRSADPRVHPTQNGVLIGTPAYMAPEQAAGLTVDERSDIYSLCVVFHEFLGLGHYLADCANLGALLAGVMGRNAESLGHQPSEHQPPVPADLVHFVRRGLEKVPEDRFQTVGEMLVRLRARQDGDIPVECPVTFAKQGVNEVGRFVDRHPYAAMTALFAIPVTALGGIAYALWHWLA